MEDRKELPPLIQPQFPMTNVNFTPQGALLSIQLAPNLAINHFIDEASMNQIVQKWLETRRELKQQVALIHDIKRTKNN